MSIINSILVYSDLFDGEAESIEAYLSPIEKGTLIDYAIKLLSLSTVHDIYKEENTLWAFLCKEEETLVHSLYQKIMAKRRKHGTSLCIINTRTSLDFFEYAFKSTTTRNRISDSQQNINVLKAYLLLNERNSKKSSLQGKEYDIDEIMLHNALEYERYIDENLLYLRVTQFIKACLFFEFCEKKLPLHLKEFENFYDIDTWKTYILYLHQVGMIIKERELHNALLTVTIPFEDDNYLKKKRFLEKFCLQKSGWDDNQDYTELKNNPIIQSGDNKYQVIFEQFFCEKVYQSLYFKFREINESFQGSNPASFVKNFRKYIPFEFSEKFLTNKLLLTAFGNKYIHLNYNDLREKGQSDYYVRNGKYIFLFECKDNLIGKDILAECNLDLFIGKLKELFVEKSNEKRIRGKAINQLINNISKILGMEYPDKKYKAKNCVIYPIIVVHNNVFSLTGINSIVNRWFWDEIHERGITHPYIKDVTIISIDTLALYQGVFPQKGCSIKEMIDAYWKAYRVMDNKKYESATRVLEEYHSKYQSFKRFVGRSFLDKEIFTQEIEKYCRLFE